MNKCEHDWITETVPPFMPEISEYDHTYCVKCNKVYYDNDWDKLMSEV
jgi:hypothetical protein